VKRIVAILLAAFICRMAWAQTNEPSLEIDVGAVMDSAQQWAQDNLDDNVLQVLNQVDRGKVEDFLKNYQEYLNGEYVLDLAQLRDGANTVLPLLQAHEETQPYAAWLQARLDYFDVAGELATNPPPVIVPSTNATPKINPSFAQAEEIWVRKVSPRSWPKAAEKFVPQLKAIFNEEKVPAELIWIAEVESGFDATARSPAGAVGMFQLMPATAKDLGLSLWPLDQRKRVEPSARAAAQYLKRLRGMFGDWRLAVAAYNCGEGTVGRALKRYGATDYEGISRYLPAETQMYVPKVEATIRKREGAELMKLKAG
jgi:membrane-bound lytic murein transglycosylase D